MSSNSFVFYTSGGISSTPAAFLFLIFLSTESNSSCVNSPSFMSSWLLIIFVIGSCLALVGFLSKFSKCCFHKFVRSFLLVAFTLALAILFLLFTSFAVCHAILDCLSSTEFLFLLIWFFMYSVCSFRYTLVNSFCAFLSFWVLGLVGFLLLLREAIFTFALFYLTANVSHGTQGLALSLVGMHSVANSKWAVTKFSFVIRSVSGISWSALNLFLSVKVYLSLISLLLSRDQS